MEYLRKLMSVEKHRNCLGGDNSLVCLFLENKFKVLFI